MVVLLQIQNHLTISANVLVSYLIRGMESFLKPDAVSILLGSSSWKIASENNLYCLVYWYLSKNCIVINQFKNRAILRFDTN